VAEFKAIRKKLTREFNLIWWLVY